MAQHKIGLVRTAGTSKRASRKVPVDRLPPDLHAGLSERFWAACERFVDPVAAAESIGCSVSFDADGALTVRW